MDLHAYLSGREGRQRPPLLARPGARRVDANTPVLSDNGKAFTDRLFGLCRCAATGNHDFDRLCANLRIEHRLAPPMRPQTNGMVQPLNGWVDDVLQNYRFRSREDLEQTICSTSASTTASSPNPFSRAEHPSTHSRTGKATSLSSSRSGHIIIREVTFKDPSATFDITASLG